MLLEQNYPLNKFNCVKISIFSQMILQIAKTIFITELVKELFKSQIYSRNN